MVWMRVAGVSQWLRVMSVLLTLAIGSTRTSATPAIPGTAATRSSPRRALAPRAHAGRSRRRSMAAASASETTAPVGPDASRRDGYRSPAGAGAGTRTFDVSGNSPGPPDPQAQSAPSRSTANELFPAANTAATPAIFGMSGRG